MAEGWDWVSGGSGGDLRVGVTTSRRELTTSTVIVTGVAAHRDSPGSHGPSADNFDLRRPPETGLLVDPSWDPDELAWIGESLAALSITVTAGFSTHAHHDHLLWHPGLPVVPRWASENAARFAFENRDQLLTALGPDWSGELAGEVGSVTGAPGPDLPWPGSQLEMITHDAHAPGHTALWVPSVRVLVAGDMLSDVELPLLEDSSIADYRHGLDALRPFANAAEVIIPGHGTPATGAQCVARWVADRRYLETLAARTDSDDPRRDRPGMEQAHQANLERAAAAD